MADLIEDEDLAKKHGLPPRPPSPSLLGELQPGDEAVQPPPSYFKPVVKEADIEIVDLGDSDGEEDLPGGRTTPPVPRNPEPHIKVEQQAYESDEEIHFIGATTNKTPRPPPPVEIKTETPDNEGIPNSNSSDLNRVSSPIVVQPVSATPRAMDSTISSTPTCPEPLATVPVGNQGGTDEDWDRDPDWDSNHSSISSTNRTTRLLPTSQTPASAAATSAAATSAAYQKSKPTTATSSTSTGSTVFSTETGTTQSSQPVAHQFVVPDVPGLSLGMSGPEKAKTSIQEVRLILNDGSTKRFVEVDGGKEKEKKTGACQTGESIINGEPAIRIPIDLNLPPVRILERNVGESRKRRHEDSSRNTRDVRSCGSQSRSMTSPRSEDYTPEFKTPKALIILMTYCEECKKKFQTRKEAGNHQKKEHNKKFCPYCYHLFSRKGSTLKDHFTACHVTNAHEETSPCFFCSQDESGPKKEFNFDGLYQHISKVHLVPVEVLARENNGRLSPDLPNLTPHISPTSSSYRPPPIVYLPSTIEDTETGPSLTLDEINNYGGNSNERSIRNPIPAINPTRPIRPTTRANASTTPISAPTTQSSAPTTQTTWRVLTNASKGLEKQKEVQQSSSSTVRTTDKSTDHGVERSQNRSKVTPPQNSPSSKEPRKSNNDIVNTRSSAAPKNNAPVSSAKTIASARPNSKTSQLPKNTTNVQVSKTRTSTTEASSCNRKSSSPSKVSSTSSEHPKRHQSQTSGTSASGTNNRTTQQTGASGDRTHSGHSGAPNIHVDELSREVKDSIKRWWKAVDDNRFPNFPSCQQIEALANRHKVNFANVKDWFTRHTEKKRKKQLARCS